MANMKKGSVGVGVIGAGSIANLAHFPSIAQIEEGRLDEFAIQ